MYFCLGRHFRQSERLRTAGLAISQEARHLRHIFVKVVSDLLLRWPHWGWGRQTGGYFVRGEREVERGSVQPPVLRALVLLVLLVLLHHGACWLLLGLGDQRAQRFAVFVFHQNSLQRTRGFSGGGGAGGGGDF